jgi:hypothetical protein|tara:strand:- start:5194 stop:5595 length:402 start_codon:yes stop_codon:yes gene_type:complete
VSSLANKIRAAQDVAVELYEVPEWDVIIELRSMSARQRAAFASSVDVSDNGNIDMGANRVEFLWGTIIQNCCFDPESAELAFTSEDIEWMMAEKNASVVDSLANACLAISGMGTDSESDAGKDSSDFATAEDG